MWDVVTCSQRLGIHPQYDILVLLSATLAVTVNTSTNNTPPYWLHGLEPYTQYTVHVRYVNEHGPAPYSTDSRVMTLQDGMRALVTSSSCYGALSK